LNFELRIENLTDVTMFNDCIFCFEGLKSYCSEIGKKGWELLLLTIKMGFFSGGGRK
jgi:hypothetical protein